MIVSVLDANLCHAYCSIFLPPLGAADVIGQPVWKYVDDKDVDEIKTRLSRCLALGETQKYWVTSDIGGDRITFRVKADRMRIDGHFMVVCTSFITPHEARDMSDTDVRLVGMLMRKVKQSQIALELGITQSAVSHREQTIKKNLGLRTREDLLHLAVSLE